MSDHEELKIVDKRRFTNSDEESSVEVDSTKISPADSVQSPTFSQTEENEPPPEIKNDREQAIDFTSFLFGLYTQALMFLGEIPNPQTQETKIDKAAAKQNIDLLNILETKTEGNLNSDEQSVLTEILNNLRLQYVKKS